MRRREFIVIAAASAGAILADGGQPATAEGAKRLYRVAFIQGAKAVSPYATRYLPAAFRDLGYAEGRNLVIEWRASVEPERLRFYIADFARQKFDVLIVSTPLAVGIAKQAAGATPIVFMSSGDPVASGIVAGFAHPGGTMTGIALLPIQVHIKRLALLKEAIPTARRIAIVVNPAGKPPIAQLQQASHALGVEALMVEIADRQGFARAAEHMVAAAADAAMVTFDPMFVGSGKQSLPSMLAAHRIPAMISFHEDVEAVGLMSYSPSIESMLRRAAELTDRILKGAKPGDLPIEEPTRFDLAVNLRAATALGLVLPPSILARADEVFE